jgi:hypothetical protein
MNTDQVHNRYTKAVIAVATIGFIIGLALFVFAPKKARAADCITTIITNGDTTTTYHHFARFDTLTAPVVFDLHYFDGGILYDAGNGKLGLRIELHDTLRKINSTHQFMVDAMVVRDTLRGRPLAISFKNPREGIMWMSRNVDTGWSDLFNSLDSLRASRTR